MQRASVLAAAAILSVGAVALGQVDHTLFLHHFDAPIGAAPADADYAAGTASTLLVGGVINGSGAKFGAGAYDTTAGGRAHYVANDGNFNFSQGTVEFWIKKNAPWNDGTYRGFFGVHAAGVADFRIYKDGSDRLGFYAHGATSGNIFGAEFAVANPPAPGEWHHIAVVWDSATDFKAVFLNGTDIGGDFGGPVTTVTAVIPAQMTIGAVQSGSAGGGHLYDEFRISDVARYTSNFTPPTAPFVVPEPASLAGFAAVGLIARRRRN
jgi:hypothetical protein